jgi:tetratricopeptide (TPR) repeat protein
MPTFSIQQNIQIPDTRNLSYDEIMTLIAWIESDSFDERCSLDELTQVNQLVSFLAMEGAAEDEKVGIEQAVASLYTTDNFQYAHWKGSNIPYAQPAIFKQNSQDIVLCRSWFKKRWDDTRAFVKKHKTAIIVGTIVVVAVAVVVVAAVVISASAAGAAAAGGLAGSSGAFNAGTSQAHQEDSNKGLESPQEGSVTAALQEQIATFKENVAPEQLAAISGSHEISLEENGRIMGSLFTHKTIDTLVAQASEDPVFFRDLQNLREYSSDFTPKWGNHLSAHTSTDLAFSTNYAPTCVGSNSDLNTLTYQTRGDWALSSGCYAQAVQDFGKAIENEPNEPNSYLGRGVANFELGHYEASIADYNTYVSQAKEPFSVSDFSVGFAKGLPKGIYDSGEGMLQFVTDLACHPVQTSEKVYDSISTLSSLAKSGEWNLIGEALSPELHQLISEWDTLSSVEKGELSGYAFGKHGADILLPGAAAKVVAKGSSVVKELGAICKNLQSAEKILVLEAVAGGSSAGFNVGEVIVSSNRTMAAGEELGLTTKEIASLKQSGELERVIGKGRDFFAGNPELQASYDLFTKAKATLRPYTKQVMPEATVRNLIHESGIPTFLKPFGIPDNYLVRITEKGAGMEYFNPIQPKTSIRVMPGSPHSPNPSQQAPYVVQTRNGKTLNKIGKEVSSEVPEAHIPLCEFVYKD